MKQATQSTGRTPRGRRADQAIALGRAVLFGVVATAALLSAGCTHVAPYERGILAHPTMGTDDPSIGLDEHVRAVSEGASGGVGGGGGGCGCN